MTTHMVVPDCQVKEGVDISHMEWIGKWAADKKPDVIICLGDFADMPSLSSYDVGKKDFEGRRYTKDVTAAKEAMKALLAPIKEEIAFLERNHKKRWKPRMVMTLGNHENRISRAVNNDPKLEGLISVADLGYEEDWEVYPFLEVVVIDGIAYSHYFTTGVMGRPVTSARAMTTKKLMSCTMGHVQKTEIDMSSFRADGTPVLSLFAGCCYLHDEDYLGAQGNVVHRQIWMKYEVEDGFYYPHAISLNYLKDRYETNIQSN